MPRAELTILLYPNPDDDEPEYARVAHCLDYDIIGVGPTDAEALEEMVGCMKAHAEFLVDHPDCLPPEPAPRPFWDALETAEELRPLELSALPSRAESARQFVLQAAPAEN